MFERMQMVYTMDTKIISEMIGNVKDQGKFISIPESLRINAKAHYVRIDVLPLLIRKQNAAVVVRGTKNGCRFDLFQLSIPNEAVLKSKNKLLVSYPGPSIEIPYHVMDDSGLIAELVCFLHQASLVAYEDCYATTRKASTNVKETRDVLSSHHITEYLAGFLIGIGTPASITRIQKRISDDVIWNNAENPWRRSQLWLMIRVALQFNFQDHQHLYKTVIINLFTTLSNMVSDNLNIDVSLLHSVQMKIFHKNKKISCHLPAYMEAYISSSVHDLNTFLEKQWQKVRFQPENEWNRLSSRELSLDLAWTKVASNKFLMQQLSYQPNAMPDSSTFSPPRIDGIKLCQDFNIIAEKLESSMTPSPSVCLMDFEENVEKFLDQWTQTTVDVSLALSNLASCFRIYVNKAEHQYSTNIYLKSRSFLTMTHLWCAIDQLATKWIPLLLEYSPELKSETLNALLLSTQSELAEVHHIQTYLKERSSNATYGSIFASDISESSFAVRWAKSNQSYHDVKKDIEAKAKEERKNLKLLFDAAKSRYIVLTKNIDQLGCTDVVDKTYIKRMKHAPDCLKCRLVNERNRLKCNVHEWPLPSEETPLWNLLFEMQTPFQFETWREITYELCTLLSMPNRKPANPIHLQLKCYKPLQPWTTQQAQRVMYASQVKSFYNSHYRNISVTDTTPETDIFVLHGPRWAIFDSTNQVEISYPGEDCDPR